MYHFRVSIHARPEDCTPGEPIELAGRRLTVLTLAPERLGATTFTRSFEQVTAELARLERLYVEPDGSFVWVSSQQDHLWQLDGVVYDHQDRVRFIDVGGSCPANQFDRLLAVLDWPRVPVMFQLTQAAVLLDEAEFRRYAELPR
jgi:hypothetical protein